MDPAGDGPEGATVTSAWHGQIERDRKAGRGLVEAERVDRAHNGADIFRKAASARSVDRSPSLLAHSPSAVLASLGDNEPVLSVSISSTSSSSYKLAPTRLTFSDLKTFDDIEHALYAQSSYGHSYSHSPTN
ncbi:hypothetical protein FRC12_002595 [Ceratobasidium sp. 428]|nr:hypothetical protein FRC09_017602 [Ceratobasidium sp. 395]KAG8796216.1 hypothetical protein FRC12_002595 [Ceratobasidium sp. 428]